MADAWCCHVQDLGLTRLQAKNVAVHLKCEPIPCTALGRIHDLLTGRVPPHVTDGQRIVPRACKVGCARIATKTE